MSDHYIGLDLFDLENNGLRQPISRITLYRGDNAALTAGDDTGLEVVADCIYVTQEMVEALLSAARGYQYHAYSAQAARLNPAAELGDTVEVGSIVSVLAQISDNGDLYPDIAAPGDREVEDEYPAAGPLTKAFDKKLAEARSEITKTTDQIALAIYGEDGKGGLNGRMNTFTMSLRGTSNEIKGYKDTITGYEEQLALYKQDLESYSGEVSKYTEEVNGYKEQVISYKGSVDGFEQRVALYQEQAGKTQEAYSLIDQKVTSIKLQVTNNDATASIQLVVDGKNQGAPAEIKMNGLVTFSALGSAPGTGQTKINGGWIDTDTLTVKNIEIADGSITWKKLSDGAKENIASPNYVSDYVGGLVEEGTLVTDVTVTEITQDAIKTCSITANQITSGTIKAGNLSLKGSLRLDYGSLPYGYVGASNAGDYTGAVLCDDTQSNYFIATRGGARMTSGDSSFYVIPDGCYSTKPLQEGSDERLKNNISYDLGDEEKLFMRLRPCSFQMNADEKGKRRWGFIAQNVIESATEVGMDVEKLAFIGESDGMYALAYSQITALNTHMIQKLMSRVAELEERL